MATKISLEEGDDDEKDVDAFKTAASEVYAAAKADDPNRFAVALKSAIEICVAEAGDEDSDSGVVY